MRGLVVAYDQALRRPPFQAEGVVEPGLVADEFGGHAAGFGPAAGGWVDEHGLTDGGELGQELADGQVQPCPGAVAHEVGELEGQHAGLLALVAGQDVEPAEDSDGTDGRWRIARKVALDRVISTVDRQARHTPNQSHSGGTGSAGTWPPSRRPGLITDCEMTMAAGQYRCRERGQDGRP